MSTESISSPPLPYRWYVLGGVWLAYFGFGLTAITLAPLILQIGTDLNLNNSQIGTGMGAWQPVHIPAVYVILLMGIGIFFFGHGLNNWLP